MINHVAQTHISVSDGIGEYFERYRRNVYVTPKSFLSFLTSYSETYLKKVANLTELASSINTGLEKLAQVGGSSSALDPAALLSPLSSDAFVGSHTGSPLAHRPPRTWT